MLLFCELDHCVFVSQLMCSLVYLKSCNINFILTLGYWSNLAGLNNANRLQFRLTCKWWHGWIILSVKHTVHEFTQFRNNTILFLHKKNLKWISSNFSSTVFILFKGTVHGWYSVWKNYTQRLIDAFHQMVTINQCLLSHMSFPQKTFIQFSYTWQLLKMTHKYYNSVCLWMSKKTGC